MAIYHLTVKNGSRNGGQSARAKANYVCRDGRYGENSKVDRDPVLAIQHGNMPSWAKHDPMSYWVAADKFERANGRLYREIEFALPRELDEQQRLTLAREFADQVTAEGLPFTMAMHAGGGTNPHCHLVFSERALDGYDRTPEKWFARANKKNPEKGGAAKTRKNISTKWLNQIREDWAAMANEHLAEHGHSERIDHRSLVDQGYEQLATVHVGPWKGSEKALQAMEYNRQAKEINAELKLVEAQIEAEEERQIDELADAHYYGTSDAVLDSQLEADYARYQEQLAEESEAEQVMADPYEGLSPLAFELAEKHSTPGAIDRYALKCEAELISLPKEIQRQSAARSWVKKPGEKDYQAEAKAKRQQALDNSAESKAWVKAKAELGSFQDRHPILSFFGFDRPLVKDANAALELAKQRMEAIKADASYDTRAKAELDRSYEKRAAEADLSLENSKIALERAQEHAQAAREAEPMVRERYDRDNPRTPSQGFSMDFRL